MTMSTTTPGRRTLRFESVDEVIPEVERLLAGHTTVGNWSLARICQHLAGAIRLAVDMPATTRHDPSLQIGAERVAEIFATGMLPEGFPLPTALATSEPLGEHEAADRLREAIDYYKASPGPVAAHRFFGPLTKEQWDHLQRIHCAHHLSFAIPKGD